MPNRPPAQCDRRTEKERETHTHTERERGSEMPIKGLPHGTAVPVWGRQRRV